ncbi:hypothetical protein CERSUDRAFT_117781 [Gelatoporia subvermispora B]|uniref:Gti1/Pac2 family-domain-containing protein n=1 Tax=Ceriporiopsis subvermispora (strain B) TaxID=914234 RepID=M2QNG7_CERS8|nr:hypothetical protein CERSUDRAFT_117781 [Gelatoporia subvermispora B]
MVQAPFTVSSIAGAAMQRPTFSSIRIRSPTDAHIIFYAVVSRMLPMVAHRLDIRERRFIQSGSVFVWEERSQLSEPSGSEIERWTDGRRWGPSRVRDEFLYYEEKLPEVNEDEELSSLMLSTRLIKKTYSVYVRTRTGSRKWHLVAYYTEQTLDQLLTIDDFPELAALRHHIPEGLFTTARLTRCRTRAEHGVDDGYTRSGGPPMLTLSSPDSSPSPTAITPPSSAHVLPRLKPEPWPLPSQTSSDTDIANNNQAQQTTSRRVRVPAQKLAPLVYLRSIPFPPRHPLDKDALRSFDGGVV